MKGYNFDGYVFAYDKTTNKFIVRLPKKTQIEYDNPIEAWTSYVSLFDIAVRKRIGDMLEKQGKNRYTGLDEVKIKDD